VFTVKLGIPRALLYYWYGPLWERFWRECGLEVVVSPPTDRAMIQAGTKRAVDEICLPVKIFLGHVDYLLQRTDRVLIPHLIKVEPEAFICPKFMGLPDIVRHSVAPDPKRLLTFKVEEPKISMRQALIRAAQKLGTEPRRIRTATAIAFGWEESIGRGEPAAEPGGPSIGLLGHAYCLQDPGFNLNITEILQRYNVACITPEQIPANWKGIGAAKLAKPLFWSAGRVELDTVEWLLTNENVDGFIHLTPFACGTEAITGDLVARRIKAAGKPLLRLNIEEHSGEAGIITRVEAFLDLLKLGWRTC
jgi:predicted nucleotide-binding protein (sugar kinase/HSP70/actin superfamily)